jgi:uncharacterized lipoprotein
MSSRLVGLMVIVLSVSACAFSPQKVEIAPHVEYSKTDIGNGKTISVAIMDGRDSTDIGHRGSAAIANGAKVTSDQNIPETFRQAIFEGLKAKGFSPVDSTKSVSRQLQVEIRSIGYSTSTGFWTGGVETKAAVMCHASVASNTYDKMYRYSGEERVVFVPTADHNSQLINKAVNEVLSQMFDDQALLSLLASN